MARVSILVVEDEADLAVTCARLLRRRGYDVITAGSCAEALSVLQRDALALVISDLRLADGDGLAVIRAARALETPAPVIAMTGFGSGAVWREVTAAGASACLAKPFSAGDFMALVDRLLVGGSPAPAAR